MLMANDSTITVATRVITLIETLIIIITAAEDRAIRVRDWTRAFRVRNK